MALAHVVLAAGGSRRFGSCKQLATALQDQSLLEYSLQLALSVSPERVYLVLGAYHEDIEAKLSLAVRYPQVEVIINEQWQEGMASSIRYAVRHLEQQNIDGIMIQLADQVAIRSDQLAGMRNRWLQNPDCIVVSDYCATETRIQGAPAVLPRRYFTKLRELEGDRGAGQLIKTAPPDEVISFPLIEAQWDIDTEDQLQRWQSMLQHRSLIPAIDDRDAPKLRNVP